LRMGGCTYASLSAELCMACAFGTGLTSWLIIGLAAAGVLYEWLVVVLILSAFVLVYPEAKNICGACVARLRHWQARAYSFCEGIGLALIGAALLVSFFAAATPPFFYDALLYHLAVPQKYLLLHHFHFLPTQYFSNFPAHLSMLFIVALSFSGGLLANLCSWVFTPLTAVAVYGFVVPRWGRPIALTAAAITLLTPGVLILSTLTAIDCGMMFYSALCIFAIVTWTTTRQYRDLFCAAICCGLAVSTKYTALVTLCLPLGGYFIWDALRAPHAWKKRIGQWLIFAGVVLLVVSPWLIKNIVFTGNPMYPFFQGIFQPAANAQFDYAQYMQQDHSLFEKGGQWATNLWLAFKAPWTVTMTTNGAAGKMGGVFLLCIPAILWVHARDRIIMVLLGLSALSFWSWVFFLPRTLRYSFGIVPLLAIVSAYILWHLPGRASLQRAALFGLGVVLTYQFALFLAEELTVLRPFGFLFANQSTAEFLLDHGVDYYPVMQYVNRELPADAKILFVGESRGYYCARDYELYTVIVNIDDRDLLLRNLIRASQTATEVVAQLRQRQITHVLFNMNEMARFTKQYLPRDSYLGLETEQEQRIYRELFSAQYFRPLISQYGVELYAVADVK
jgi:4-amino-4-deoxy-L-arabinose transferase-like glycosyltransferase